MTDISRMTKLLRVIAVTIENLSQEQFDELLAGKGRLSFVAQRRKKEADKSNVIEQERILGQLGDCSDRERARHILSAVAGRNALASVARSIKVHVHKHDRRDDIESKIIEFVIGGRLRTEAIRSLNLKNDGDTVD